ncbi:MAG TPA: Ig-like domain-containing protein [Gemmatimonadales bacterium]
MTAKSVPSFPLIRARYWAALLLPGGLGCADAVGGDGIPSAQFAIRAELPSAMANGFFDLDIDRVRIRMTRPPAEPVLDTVVLFPADSSQLTVRLRVPLVSRREQLVLAMELRSGQRLLFAGSREVEVTDAATVAPAIPLQYVGPGQQVNGVRIEPRDSVLKPGDTFTFKVFGFFNGVPVDEFYVGWASANPAIAAIDAAGSVTAPGNRGSVMIHAITPTGVKDSTRLWFSPPPASMSLVGGNNQIGFAGSQLGALLAVQLVATDGLGVPGWRVRFIPLGGGSVRDTLAITDAEGVARTVATLGHIAGNQPFEALIPFQPPVIFNIVAIAGPPARVLPLSGNGQTGQVGTLLNNLLVASVTDIFGNPAGGVPVTWSILSGNGTLEEASLETNPSGLATALFRLGATPGGNTVRAAVGAAPLFTDFSATGTIGVADSIEIVSGDSVSALPGSTLPPFVVRVTDAVGNPVAGVTVTWEIVTGTGVLTPASSLTDAAGTASTVYRLGPGFGTREVQARIPGGKSVLFTATAAP